MELMWLMAFPFVIGACAGYAWGNHDGRLEELGRRLYRNGIDERKFMDMDRVYCEREKKLQAEVEHYKRLLREVKP